MTDMPQVSPRDWIRIGGKDQVYRISAVVCNVYNGLSVAGGNVEVVYLDKKEAINMDVKWVGTHWEFASSPGGHADGYPRLQSYVKLLRSGRWTK